MHTHIYMFIRYQILVYIFLYTLSDKYEYICVCIFVFEYVYLYTQIYTPTKPYIYTQCLIKWLYMCRCLSVFKYKNTYISLYITYYVSMVGGYEWVYERHSYTSRWTWPKIPQCIKPAKLVTLTSFMGNILTQVGTSSYAGNTNSRRTLSTVDLLIKVTRFVKKKIMFASSKAADLN